jgi:hypothetical protein
MRNDIPADLEKTQDVPGGYSPGCDRELGDFRLKENLFAKQCENARQMNAREILAELFSYHPPTDVTIPKYAAINQAAKNFAEIVLANCPRGADFSRVIHLIQDARMTANRSIALNGLSLY